MKHPTPLRICITLFLAVFVSLLFALCYEMYRIDPESTAGCLESAACVMMVLGAFCASLWAIWIDP